MSRDDRRPEMALPAWGLAAARCVELRSGHINRTWRVEDGRSRYTLQWLNPIFDPVLHHDIEAVTARLARCGLETPRLVRTAAGDLWATDADGDVWRLLTWVEGETVLAADSPARCAAAGRLLGAFHRALWDFEHTFAFGRSGVHDTRRHLDGLAAALQTHAAHPAFAAVEPVAAAILAAAADLPVDAALPRRIVHGDPKISNVVFAPDGRARCLVDLDTLARLPIAVELGDAFRSWCQRGGEEAGGAAATFRLDHFEAGLAGYAAAVGPRPTATERAAIPAFVETITVELAARFCADALHERYFGWDRARFARAADHNLARARAQLALARSIRSQRSALEATLQCAW